MLAQKTVLKQKEVPPTKPLAGWKKLLLALFGSYLAAKFFGILLPNVSAAGLSSHADKDNQAFPSNNTTDEYSDDTWDYPAEDRYEDEYIYEKDEPVDDPLYDDWDDWNEGYDDDHFR